MEKEKLKKMVDSGLSQRELSKEFLISQTSIRYWLRKYGLNTLSKISPKDFKEKRNESLCLQCKSELTGSKKKFCCQNCKAKFHYHQNNKSNNNTNERQKRVSTERKSLLVKMSGGKCCKCGYNKNYAALQFHHLNPEEKTFNLDSRKLSNTNWNSILIEWKKCILLCANYHLEVHHPEKEFKNTLNH